MTRHRALGLTARGAAAGRRRRRPARPAFAAAVAARRPASCARQPIPPCHRPRQCLARSRSRARLRVPQRSGARQQARALARCVGLLATRSSRQSLASPTRAARPWRARRARAGRPRRSLYDRTVAPLQRGQQGRMTCSPQQSHTRLLTSAHRWKQLRRTQHPPQRHGQRSLAMVSACALLRPHARTCAGAGRRRSAYSPAALRLRKSASFSMQVAMLVAVKVAAALAEGLRAIVV
mmetsp:Transcript_40883/g.122063  ORF Transcript_40883/g.122063 Transcript_40883/m.122063 type:complete len:236 (+) Transcript_40883:260-967(+)